MAFARHVSDGPKQGAIEGLIYPVRTRGSSLEHAMDMDTLYIYITYYILYICSYIPIWEATTWSHVFQEIHWVED